MGPRWTWTSSSRRASQSVSRCLAAARLLPGRCRLQPGHARPGMLHGTHDGTMAIPGKAADPVPTAALTPSGVRRAAAVRQPLPSHTNTPADGAVTDNWPTIEPYFNETGSNSPSVLPSYQQRELLELAVKSCKALGLQIVSRPARLQPPPGPAACAYFLASCRGPRVPRRQLLLLNPPRLPAPCPPTPGCVPRRGQVHQPRPAPDRGQLPHGEGVFGVREELGAGGARAVGGRAASLASVPALALPGRPWGRHSPPGWAAPLPAHAGRRPGADHEPAGVGCGPCGGAAAGQRR